MNFEDVEILKRNLMIYRIPSQKITFKAKKDV
jgi:hypothetical protein